MTTGVRCAVPGDSAVADADGTITLLGRGLGVINTGGEKVYPEEVEVALKAAPGRARRGRGRRARRRWGERVVAVVHARGPRPTRRSKRSRRTRGNTSPATRCRATIVFVDDDRALPVGQARLPLGQGHRGRGRKRTPARSLTSRTHDQSPRRTRPARTCSSTRTTRSTGIRGATRRSPRARDRGQADLPLDRLLGLPLVPRDGARVFEDADIAALMNDALRQHQGRPRGAPRPRRALHGGRPGA